VFQANKPDKVKRTALLTGAEGAGNKAGKFDKAYYEKHPFISPVF
jgi:hypothetical protein